METFGKFTEDDNVYATNPGVTSAKQASVVIVLTRTEAEELYRFTQYSYLNPNEWPALLKLLDRVERVVKAKEATYS